MCKGPAVIDVRRHNAAFCRDHFVHHCDEQVRRAIHAHQMLEPGDRVLVAVSGGKDSLALWDLLVRARLRGRRPLPRARHRRLLRRVGRVRARVRGAAGPPAASRSTSRRRYGFDIPQAAEATRRSPCGACGLSKRHLFNAAALEHGYDVVATGHNLDDEAAVLLGNVLRWETGYLGRQHPVLPAAPGFVSKVKPLVRLGEREIAAYCVLQGIDYQVEECPMAAGNRHLGYKEVLNALEDRSPGSKAAFLFGFLERGHERFAGEADERARRAGGVPRVRRAHARRRVPRSAASGRRSARSSSPVVDAERRGADVARAFAAGDRVLLVDAKRRRHLITLAEGGEFHTHAGVLAHDDIIGQPDGVTVRTTRNARLAAVRPTLAEYVLEMPRGAQVIYPKDLGPILMLADIFPGARVLESGVGSGALTIALLRAIGPHRSRHRLRDPRRLRPARPQQRRGLPRHRRPARRRGARRLRGHRRATTSTASCSTCPNRGGS